MGRSARPTDSSLVDAHFEPIRAWHLTQRKISLAVTAAISGSTVRIIGAGPGASFVGGWIEFDDDANYLIGGITGWTNVDLTADYTADGVVVDLSTTAPVYPSTGAATVYAFENGVVKDKEFRSCDICGRVWPMRLLQRNESNDTWGIVCRSDHDAPNANDYYAQEALEERMERVSEYESHFGLDLEDWI